MRALLMSVMLIIAVIAIYHATIGGNGGIRDMVTDRGQRINDSIERINP